MRTYAGAHESAHKHALKEVVKLKTACQSFVVDIRKRLNYNILKYENRKYQRGQRRKKKI